MIIIKPTTLTLNIKYPDKMECMSVEKRWFWNCIVLFGVFILWQIKAFYTAVCVACQKALQITCKLWCGDDKIFFLQYTFFITYFTCNTLAFIFYNGSSVVAHRKRVFQLSSEISVKSEPPYYYYSVPLLDDEPYKWIIGLIGYKLTTAGRIFKCEIGVTSSRNLF